MVEISKRKAVNEHRIKTNRQFGTDHVNCIEGNSYSVTKKKKKKFCVLYFAVRSEESDACMDDVYVL